jgi:hypothetical protein
MLPNMSTQNDLCQLMRYIVVKRQLQPPAATTVDVFLAPGSSTTMRAHNVECRQFVNRNRIMPRKSIVGIHPR